MATLLPNVTEVAVDQLTPGSAYQVEVTSRSGPLTSQSEFTVRTGSFRLHRLFFSSSSRLLFIFISSSSRLLFIFISSSFHLHLLFISSSSRLHLVFFFSFLLILISSSSRLHLVFFISSSSRLHLLVFFSSSCHLHLVFISSSSRLQVQRRCPSSPCLPPPLPPAASSSLGRPPLASGRATGCSSSTAPSS